MNATVNLTGNWKPKLLVMGTFLGASLGLATAFLLAREAEQKYGQEDLSISAGDILKTSLGVITTVRSVASLGAGNNSA